MATQRWKCGHLKGHSPKKTMINDCSFASRRLHALVMLWRLREATLLVSRESEEHVVFQDVRMFLEVGSQRFTMRTQQDYHVNIANLSEFRMPNSERKVKRTRVVIP